MEEEKQKEVTLLLLAHGSASDDRWVVVIATSGSETVGSLRVQQLLSCTFYRHLHLHTYRSRVTQQHRAGFTARQPKAIKGHII